MTSIKPIRSISGVYENTVIRRAEIDVGESLEDEPQVTVVLERAIDASRIFKFTQDLMTHKEAAGVHRVFFSEVSKHSATPSDSTTCFVPEKCRCFT